MLRTNSRREFLALATAGLAAAKPDRLIIDTHLEVWTFDPKFPFHHPERPDLKRVDVEAPIENEVAEMREFGLKYAVLINPRFYGWDTSFTSYSPPKDPRLFAPHRVLNSQETELAGRVGYLHRDQGG